MRSWPEPAVELRLCKIRGCLAQDLVGLAQLAHFPLEILDPPMLRAARARAALSIALGPTYPAAQRLCRAADLRCNRADPFPLRTVLAPVLTHHPNRTLADLT